MGRKPYSIEDILESEVLLSELDSLTIDVRKFAQKIIKEGLSPNPYLIINGKKIRPKRLSLWNLTWSDLILVKEYVSESNMVEVLKIIYKLTPEKLDKLLLFNSFAVWKWVNEELQSIRDLEKQELHEEYTGEEKEAGIEELEIYGHSLAIDNLAGGNPEFEVIYLETPYIQIFKKLSMKKAKRQFKERIDKIRNDKVKQKQRNAYRTSKGGRRR